MIKLNELLKKLKELNIEIKIPPKNNPNVTKYHIKLIYVSKKKSGKPFSILEHIMCFYTNANNPDVSEYEIDLIINKFNKYIPKINKIKQ